METKKFLDGEGLATLWKEITSLQSDYNEVDEASPNYIKNKPFVVNVSPEVVDEAKSFVTATTVDSSTGLPTNQYVQLFTDLKLGQKLNLEFTYPELAAATGEPAQDNDGNIIYKTVRYENVEVGNFADAMGSSFSDSPAIMMGPGALIATLPETIQAVAVPNDDIVFVYSNAVLADGTKTPLLITGLLDWVNNTYSTYEGNCSIATFTPEEISLEATRENHIALQSDWDEQNKEDSSFIQNKPFGDEVVQTPKNEFYMNSFKEWYGDDSSGMGNPGYSLQTEIGKQYVVSIYMTNGEFSNVILTCVDHTFDGIDLPEGGHFLGDFDSTGKLQSLFFLVDHAKLNESEDAIIYDESSSLIMLTNEVYKMIIHDTPLEGTYDRTITHIINPKYLPKADQSYDWTSENPQSGIAVNEAISQVTNKLPSSVIASLIAPTTLGDKHIKVQWSSTNSNTSPQTTTYNIYTEGIGLNSDLQTTAKDTIVNAINENLDNLNKYKTRTVVAISDADRIWVNGNDILLCETQTSYDKIPYNYTIAINNVGVSSKVYGTGTNGFLDLLAGTIYKFDKNGKLQSTTITNKSVLDSNMSQIDKICSIGDYYYYCHYEKWNNNTGANISNSTTIKDYFYIIALLTDGTYGTFQINENGTCTALIVSTNTYEGDYVPVGSYYEGKSSISETSTTQYGTYTVAAYDKLYGFEPTTLEKPGLLKASVIDKTFGADTYTNGQVIGSTSDDNYTFFRALKEDGTEIVEIYKNGISSVYRTYNGIDNNEHSSYCNLSDNNSNIICLTSSQEVLCRNSINGSILWRKPIQTTSDLFTKNLQYITLINYGTNLYINDQNNLYCLDISEDNPTMVLLESSENPHEICKFADNLIRYSNTKERFLDIYTLREVFLPDSDLFKNVQSDYEQTDIKAVDYIKNKPITVKSRKNYILENCNFPVVTVTGNEAFTIGDKLIENCVLGEYYTIEMQITSTEDNSVNTYIFNNVKCFETCNFWQLNYSCPGFIIGPETMMSQYPSLINPTYSDNGCIFMYVNNATLNGYDNTQSIYCAGMIDESGNTITNITIDISIYQDGIESEINDNYAKALQSDFAENDHTKVGFIKNRTHYEEEKFVQDLELKDTDGQVEKIIDSDDGFILGYKILDYKLKLIPNNIYKFITWITIPDPDDPTKEQIDYDNQIPQSVMALKATDLFNSVPEDLQEVIALMMLDENGNIDTSNPPVAIIGAEVDNIDNLFDINHYTKIDGTMILGYTLDSMLKDAGYNIKITLLNYNNTIPHIKQIDKKYLPLSSDSYEEYYYYDYRTDWNPDYQPTITESELNSAFHDWAEGYVYEITDYDSTTKTGKLRNKMTDEVIDQVFTWTQTPSSMNYKEFYFIINSKTDWKMIIKEDPEPFMNTQSMISCPVSKGYNSVEFQISGIAPDWTEGSATGMLIIMDENMGSTSKDKFWTECTSYGQEDKYDIQITKKLDGSSFILGQGLSQNNKKAFSYSYSITGKVVITDNKIYVDSTQASCPILETETELETAPVNTTITKGWIEKNSNASFNSFKDIINYFWFMSLKTPKAEMRLVWRRN